MVRAPLAPLLLMACGLPATHSAFVEAGECEGNAYERSVPDAADTGESEEVVSAEVQGDSILLLLEDVDANCCPSPGVEVAFGADSIRVDFEDVTVDEACGCTCITDFTITVEDVEPGTWTVNVYYYDALLGSVEATVE